MTDEYIACAETKCDHLSGRTLQECAKARCCFAFQRSREEAQAARDKKDAATVTANDANWRQVPRCVTFDCVGLGNEIEECGHCPGVDERRNA